MPVLQADRGRGHWAFQPLASVPVPPVRNTSWPLTDIDRFLLSALEAKGLAPIGETDRYTLLRRVTFDLVGLAPTVAEIDAFLADSRPDAFERVVDRLLASPRFGERWGRHWLDVARYADSNGKDEDFTFYHAWRYRDYVIAAFNRDKPFDQFLREQIAGDLLPARSPQQRDEYLVATGFLAIGPKVLAERDKARLRMDVVDEQLDTIGKAFLGLSLGCARCHDHKFDPITTREYYALAGIFTSTVTLEGIKGNNAVISGWVERPLGADGAERYERYQAAVKKLQALREQLTKAQAELKKAQTDTTSGTKTAADTRLAEQQAVVSMLQRQVEALQKELPAPPPMCMSVREARKPGPCRIHIRGSHEQLGPEVPRGFIAALTRSTPPAIPDDSSGRLQLAQWLTTDAAPLVARVTVNRIWHHLFGRGLVASVDHFGTTGDRPTHPELLDYLAQRFIQEGWSVKKTIRLLVTSRAYRLSSRIPASAEATVRTNMQRDPDNTLLWRARRKRLEAEAIRDAMLQASDQLDLTMGGSTVAEFSEWAVGPNARSRTDPEKLRRRSVYLPVIRNDLPALFQVFDFANADVPTGRREVTNVPAQALFLLNSAFVIEQARACARILTSEPTTPDAERIRLAYLRLVQRPPDEQELSAALAFLHNYRQRAAQSLPKGRDPTLEAWTALCQALMASAEFRYLD
ncbi:MAG: hypothetical protein C4297_06630 [Gemmataceae bacterium]